MRRAVLFLLSLSALLVLLASQLSRGGVTGDGRLSSTRGEKITARCASSNSARSASGATAGGCTVGGAPGGGGLGSCEREALAAREERRAEAARAAEALAEAAAARATQEQTLRDSEAARAQSEALLGRLAAVASSLSDRCAQLTQQTEQPAAHDPQPPPLEVVGRPRAPPAAARQQQQAGPLTLPALLALLRSAEVELSQLDERLNDRGTSAEEAAQLQLQMGSVGKRLRAVAALRGALSRQR